MSYYQYPYQSQTDFNQPFTGGQQQMEQPGVQQPQPQQQMPGQQPGFQPYYQPSFQQFPTQQAPAIAAPQFTPLTETSYIENILRLNKGKVATAYFNFTPNEYEPKVFRGVIEAAGKDHIILSDPETGMRYLLLQIYLLYVTFDEEIEYEYPFAMEPGFGTQQPDMGVGIPGYQQPQQSEAQPFTQYRKKTNKKQQTNQQ
ncbi:spore coat protein GerQ [Haloplasma contractile]|uniref:Spore coat protein GerQ n=1 Tax=Haloplasma contractile SSD-17B TaxID=1033810 RepID=U2DVW1_9MOLU|nr:spore coat protein GerQ [Haloplasma contractile]ERJ12482.1 Spore coat protein GerQ [Haloplasma contractile SSD-17B]